tara:strand:+ start:3718 stop:5919 length:2202 start_codon:yes stop_codon:yes gene_type:complete
MFESFNKFTETINEAKAQYMIGDKEASREDVLSYMFSNPKKPLGSASYGTGKFPKWVQSNSTPDGDTITWSTIKKDMKTLEKEYGKGNVVVSGNTNGGDPVVEIYMKSQNESVVNEAKAITDRDIKVGNSFKIGSSTFKVIKIYKDPKFGNVVNTERYTNNKKAGEYTDTLKDFVDFLNEEDAVAESVVTEAKMSKIHKAAKQGSYPAVIVVVQDGKVIHQEPVSTPEHAPAAFNVMQEKYPKALLHLEDNTGKRLFSESAVTEGREVNKFGIESRQVWKLQGDKMRKFVYGNGTPFGLISSPESGLSVTDKNLVKDYVNADNIVLGFYPMENSNNDTMYDAVKTAGVRVMIDLVSKEYDLELVKTLKGKKHCAGDTCSVMHYLVFSKANESVITEKSFNKIQAEWSNLNAQWVKVTTMMMDLAAAYKEAEGKEKEDLLDELKVLTKSKKILSDKKDALEQDLDSSISDKNKDLELVIKESATNYMVDENLSRDVHRSVNAFIKKMADKYDIPLQHAVNNIMDVLRSQNYEGLSESNDVEELNERRIVIKRRYTENHPAITVGKSARIRNKMLEAIADGKLTKEEFNTILKEMSIDSKRWTTRNVKYFNLSEDGVSLSKYGRSVLKQTAVNEKFINETFTSFINEAGHEDDKGIVTGNDFNKLKGGMADGLTVDDIAKEHNVSSEVIDLAIKKGVKVEAEHTDDATLAYEIAKDHVFEDPKYYDKLEKIEGDK